MKKFEGLHYYDVKEFSTIKEMLELAVKEDGNKIAFKYKNNDEVIEVTYKEFEQDTINLGTALTNINMQKNHIAIIGENSYKWLTVYLSVLKSSGVIVPIDKDLPKDDIINLLNHSDSEVLFFSKKYDKYLEEFKEKAPKIKYFINLDEDEEKDNIFSYDKFIQIGKKLFDEGNKEYLSLTSNPNELKMLIYTSGTTGNSKGVMLSEHNLVNSVYYGLQVSTVFDTCLSVLPYHHTYEAVAGILVGLHHHSTICINDSFKAILKNLELYKPDYIYLVPAFVEVFYKRIWANAKKEHIDVALKVLMKLSNGLRKIGIDKRKTLFKSIHQAFGGKLRKIVVGGAPIRAELGTFFDTIGIDLINGYGITECSPLVSANMDNYNDCATVGIQLPCLDIKFDNITPEGKGEICVKGDVVMLGYYKNEELTNEVLIDGWFNTGDYGKINDKNQLLITGRKKNLIVLDNGKNVFPEEIENYILGIPYIQEVVVKGIKDERGIETGLLAEVFLSQEKIEELNITPTEDSIKKNISAVCTKLPIYKKVSKVIIRKEEFPKTTTNKIKR